MKFKKGDYFFTEIGDIYELIRVNDSEEFILIRNGSWIFSRKIDYNDLYKTPFYLRREGKYYFCSYENLFKFNKVHREFDEIGYARQFEIGYEGQFESAFHREFLIEKSCINS